MQIDNNKLFFSTILFYKCHPKTKLKRVGCIERSNDKVFPNWDLIKYQPTLCLTMQKYRCLKNIMSSIPNFQENNWSLKKENRPIGFDQVKEYLYN
jgi:hypothetical protein